MISKSECQHKNKVKSGKHLYSDGFYQMFRCLDCGTTIKGNKIIENVRPAAKMNAQSKNQTSVKEGDSNE